MTLNDWCKKNRTNVLFFLFDLNLASSKLGSESPQRQM
ncbi:hypothetical protein LEP1GSC176_1265 [Leptospira kirschneri str. MMD1493]|nr:hypothetical protein LEP1GSC176_1265 [Leptospira kirschneri str. MMD1493]